MNIENLLQDMENEQNDALMFEKRKKLKAQREQKKRVAKWDRIREVLPQLEKDLKPFIGVKFNGYNGYKYNGVFNVISSCRLIKPAFNENDYINAKFESKENYCVNIRFLENSDDLKIQAQLSKDSDNMRYILTSEYYTFSDAEQYLSLPKGKGYASNPLPKYQTIFNTHEELIEYLTNFFKKTINIESFKEKHNKVNSEVQKVVSITSKKSLKASF